MEALKPNKGAVKKTKRIGRGPGSGMGGTSTKGHKGQKARKGAKIRLGFEGGQTPLIRRLPKRGFNNKKFQDEIVEINIFMLNKFEDGSVVNIESLKRQGLIDSNKDLVKILSNGKLEKKLEIHAHKFSKAAIEKIEKSGGKAVLIK